MFVTEQNYSARLRKVDDAELRRLIVVMYAPAESHLHAFGVLPKLGDTVRVISEAPPNHLRAHRKEQRTYLTRLTRLRLLVITSRTVLHMQKEPNVAGS